MSEQRLISAERAKKMMPLHTTDYHGGVKALDNTPTIDPETLPIVQELRAQLERVTQERDAAIVDIQRAFLSPDDSCLLCRWYQDCEGESCSHYTCGKGLTDTEDKFHPDVTWSCEDFAWGTCDKLKDTPCNGCNFRNHWQWRGRV